MHYGKKASRQRQCHALGMFCRETLGPAVHVDVTLTRTTYLSTVTVYVHPFMETVFPDGCGLFQQDNAPCHKAKMVQEWFDEHKNKSEMLTWPPNSSDLNPIKHLWDVLDKQVRSMEAPPCNLEDIKDLLLTSWCQIPQHTFRDLVESMPWVRAVLAAKGPGRLAVINGTMNSAVYQIILKENVRPSVCDLKLKRTWVLQQDNDPKHTSKSTTEWLKKNKMKTLEWPSQSPDLNPIAMLWHDLKKVVHARKPSNVAELQQFCKDEWAKIPPQRCNRLIASYGKRLIAVVAAKEMKHQREKCQ
ncbi:hypothetical protein QTP70_007233 [Hemibagrus guttatus]|uniref:Tc1-like transposase DDE domain-containing protein n=1 Tax=Hemibagrus guttatus TaxID=175788 RepID=A0AAE0UNQ9_9TELE|nr:hypothetical protein QTP70_007233 [Hemibagrus guttatus]